MSEKTKNLPLGGPLWLRAQADEKEEMCEAMPSELFENEGNNILDSVRLFSRRKNVTIGIGMIFSDGIILASDSLTEEESNLKRLDLEKITLSEASDSLRWGIVQAGKTDFSSRCVKLVKQEVTLSSPKTAGEFIRVVEACAAEVRRHALKITGEARQAAVDSYFELIIGVVDPQPRLYVLNSFGCDAREETRGRACIGTGSILADYILDGIPLSKEDRFHASFVAIYAIEIVKTKDRECSGFTRVAVLVENARECIFVEQPTLDELALDCREYEADNQKKWSNDLLKWMIGKYLERNKKQK